MADIILFPAIDDVFVNPSDSHKTIFFPLLTVDLNSIGKGNGKVHFITVYGNGDPEADISGSDFGYNFIKFKIIGDKYRFNGDFNQIPRFANTAEWYKEAELIYTQHKDKYLTRTEFTKKEDERRQKIDFHYYFYIRGLINYWLTRDKYLETGKFIQGNSYSNGNSNHERKMYEVLGGSYDDEYGLEDLEDVLNELHISFDSLNFIGNVTGYNYSELGEDEILLFVNKDKTEVFQYFNWS